MSTPASQALVEQGATLINGPVAVVPGQRREMTPMEMVGRALEMGVSAEILSR
jgi:hypothetical protein